MSKRFLISTVLVLLIVLPLFFFGNNNSAPIEKNTEINNGIIIQNETLLLSSGIKENIYLINKNEFLIINLWASWCSPCLEEIPELNKLSRHPDINILGLVINDTEEDAISTISDLGINYPIVIKRLYVDKILDQIIWSGIPTSVILNKKNEVVSTIYGKIDEKTILKLINSLSNWLKAIILIVSEIIFWRILLVLGSGVVLGGSGLFALKLILSTTGKKKLSDLIPRK